MSNAQRIRKKKGSFERLVSHKEKNRGKHIQLKQGRKKKKRACNTIKG